jgi:hypothetical protein
MFHISPAATPMRLPAPDQYGNYWLDRSHQGPAILKAGKTPPLLRTRGLRGVDAERDYWFLSLPEGVVTESVPAGPRPPGVDGVDGDERPKVKKIRYWKTPDEAFEAYRKMM